jgi:SAM-dependent methyltransferase
MGGMMPKIDSFALQKELLIVGAAVRVGLFDILKDDPMTLRELSGRTGTDLRSLWTVTEALIALEYLFYEEAKLKLTDDAYSIFYDKNSTGYTDFSFMHRYNLISLWLRLPEVLRTGKPVSRNKQPEEQEEYIAAMTHYAQGSAKEIAEYCFKGLEENPRVLDVGGGPLTNAKAFAERGARVTVLDLPEVIDMMLPRLEPFMDIKMHKGDFTKGLPQGPYDLIYLGNVCHLNGEETNRKLFIDAFNELKSGGKLVIKDMIRGTGPEPALFAVNMLVYSSEGGTWTFKQYKNWLEEAGFVVSNWEEISQSQLIAATKK